MTPQTHQEENAAIRLARYLREFVSLRATTVRDVAKYESVLWFHDIPQEPDCRCGAWSDDYESGEPWLEVKKQRFEKMPAPPEVILPWIDERALRRATVDMPALQSTAFLPDEDVDLDEGETPPIVKHLLDDHPEVKRAFAHYLPIWTAWSTEYRRRDLIQKIYAELFNLHTQVQKQGEIYEVVLGLGLVDWRSKLNDKVIAIRRHAVVARIEVEFDPAEGLIRIVPPSEGGRLSIEDDMIEPELRPDHAHYVTLGMQLDEIGDDIWDKARLHLALRSWASALGPNGQWSPNIEGAVNSSDDPVVTLAPALILRRRTQTGMVRIYDELIRQLSDPSTPVPKGWTALLQDVDAEELDGDVKHGSVDSTSREVVPDEPSEVYFPLPANREQRRIVDAIERHRGVVVQGPPGTGKSHTIANLMCHLLATGKRVLITAETSRALQVLKDKLPPDLQSLCVSMLGQGGDAFAELNKAVHGITTRQAAYSPGAYDKRIDEIDRELDQARRLLAQTDFELTGLREAETHVCSVAGGAYDGTASTVAERVARESERHGWLRVPSDTSSALPVPGEDLLKWLYIRRTYTDDDVVKASLRIPSSSDLPTPDEFADAVRRESISANAFNQAHVHRLQESYAPIRTLTPAARTQLAVDLREAEATRNNLARHGSEWGNSAILDYVHGRRARWDAVRERGRDRLAMAEKASERIGSRVVAFSDGLDMRRVRLDAAAAHQYFSQGGQWKKFGLFTPGTLKDRRYLRERVTVNGEGAIDASKLSQVVDHVDIQLALEDLQSLWTDNGVQTPAGDWRIRLAVLREQHSLLDQFREYANACASIAKTMAAAVPPVPEPNWIGDDMQKLLDIIEATAIEDHYREMSVEASAGLTVLSSLRELHDAHPVIEALAGAIEARNVSSYSQNHALVISTETARADKQERLRIAGVVASVLPGFLETVVSSLREEVWDARFAAWDEAWNWSVANAWLRKRTGAGYQQKLWELRKEYEQRISELLGEGAALRAWTHFFNRLSVRQSAALKSWREAVKSIGKGTGRSTKMTRVKQEARDYMDECRESIPVWILPRYLVAEMIKPAPERYDIVIVDEASQLGIESHFLFYISKKMVVVGDDQQISPYGVGIADESIASLQRAYLSGIPHQHAASAQSSLYSNAKIRFSQNIVLREHFRCMPEIIQFSNDLCYASNGTPLDPLRAYPANRLQPLVLRNITDGYRMGGSQHAYNPPEADAIVAQIAACMADPRYKDATMGVVSLQGEAQAKLIERKLLTHFDPAVIHSRRLICGDAYAFQGDERNIIFLSMVAAKGENRIGVLAKESDRQRFNVAMSRAQDQVWLFHTATLDDLSSACIRHRLLRYMIDPSRQTTEELTQRFDSDFERDVYRLISERGFHVRTQVCVGDPTNHRYRIDLVVEGMQGRLAVECDGDKWHGIERYEQDMARQRDLERAGWQFERIRGSDFYLDQNRSIARVWHELERLGIRPGGIDKAAASPPAPLNLETLAGGETGLAKPVESGSHPATDKREPATPIDKSGMQASQLRPGHGMTIPTLPESRGGARKRVGARAPNSEGDLFSPVGRTLSEAVGPARYVSFEGKAGPDPRQADPELVAGGLVRIVQTEGPMLAKRAYDIYLRTCGILRMKDPVKRLMNKALQQGIQNSQIAKEDESGRGGLVFSIIRPTNRPHVFVRERGPRDFEEIPPSELQLVARLLEKSDGLSSGSEAHLRAILKFYDLKRLTDQVETALLDYLTRRYPYVDMFIETGGSPF